MTDLGSVKFVIRHLRERRFSMDTEQLFISTLKNMNVKSVAYPLKLIQPRPCIYFVAIQWKATLSNTKKYEMHSVKNVAKLSRENRTWWNTWYVSNYIFIKLIPSLETNATRNKSGVNESVLFCGLIRKFILEKCLMSVMCVGNFFEWKVITLNTWRFIIIRMKGRNKARRHQRTN